MTPVPLIALLTDFGQSDGFVGIMKGVIAGICPEARTVDLAHDIAPQNIRHGQIVLAGALPYFPAGTVFLVVVDPGVGGERRALVGSDGKHFFVAPDNGVLTPVLSPEFVAHEMRNPSLRLLDLSATFHGRDLFAPAAAHLARGICLSEFGPQIAHPTALPIPEPSPIDGGLSGEVIHIDRFGNAFLNVRPKDLPDDSDGGWHIVTQLGVVAPLCHAYSDVPAGNPVAVINSFGWLELALFMGSAAEQFGIAVGDQVWVLKGPGEKH